MTARKKEQSSDQMSQQERMSNRQITTTQKSQGEGIEEREYEFVTESRQQV